MSKFLSGNRIVLALASLMAIGALGGVLVLLHDSPEQINSGPVAMNAGDSKTALQSEVLNQKSKPEAGNRKKLLSETQDNISTQSAKGDSALVAENNTSAQADKETDSSDVAARIQLIRQLRNEKTEQSVQILQDFLADENRAVVFASLNSLAYIGKDSHLEDKVFDILVEKSGDMQFQAHGQALIMAALYGRDEQILPVISNYIDAQDDEQGAEKRHAASALAAIASPECVDYLQLILERSKDIETKRSALDTLSRIDSPKSTQILEQTLYDGYSEDQLQSTWALSMRNTSEYNQILYNAMANRQLDEIAVSVVARNPAGPTLLKEVLQNADFNNDEKVTMVKIYAENMTRTNSKVRSDIVETVKPLVNGTNDDLSLEAIRILGMGFGPEDTAEILNPKFESSNQQIRRAALDAYTTYLTKDNYKPVLDLIWDDDESIRRQAIMVSQQYIDESDLPVIEKALNHEDEAIRESASHIMEKYETN